MKKIIALLTASVLCLVGCAKKEPQASPAPETTNSITVLAMNDDADALSEIAEGYQQAKGIDVKIISCDAKGYTDRLISLMGGENMPDIFLVAGQLGYRNWESYCRDLSDTGLYEQLADSVLAVSDGNGIFALPLKTEVYGILYNRDILQRYFALPTRASTVSSIENIDSFVKLREVVEDMSEHLDELGIDGVFAPVSLADGTVRMSSYLINVPIWAELSETDGYSTASYAASEGISFKYSENYKNAVDLITGNNALDGGDYRNVGMLDGIKSFAAGHSAMMLGGSFDWDYISEVDSTAVDVDNIGIMPIYTGLGEEENQGLCVGSTQYIAVNASADSEKQAAAIEFLKWLYTGDGKALLGEKLGFMSPYTQTGGNPISAAARRHMDKRSVEWVFNAFPDTFAADVTSALAGYLDASTTYESFSNTVVTSWASQGTLLGV